MSDAPDKPAMMHLRITTQDRVTVCDLPDGQWTVGRSRMADIRIDNPSVSRIHCRVERDAENVWVENYSARGSLLDGQPVTERMLWPRGAVLKLGSSLVTWLQEDSRNGGTSGISSLSTGLMVKGASDTASQLTEKATQLQTGATYRAPSPAGAENLATQTGGSHTGSAAETLQAPYPSTGTTASSSQAGTGHDARQTVVMRTLLVTPEELELAREDARRRRVYRQTAIGVVVLLAGIFILAYLLKPVPPPEIVEWPKDNTGKSIEHEYDAPLGEFRVILPGSHSKRKELADGVFEATCLLGRNSDVPLVFRIEDVSNVVKCATLPLPALAERWTSGAREPGSKWLFEEPRGTALYFGRDNGTPFVLINFTRTEAHGRKWIGCARLFRSGARLSVVSTCTPVEYHKRMENMLNLEYVSLSDEYVAACWEPLEPVGDDNLAQMLDEVRVWMKRDVPPLSLRGTEDSLRKILTRATVQGDTAAANDALALLVRLRDKMRKWYNLQKLAFERAVDLRKDDEARRIKKLCEGVFNNPLDRRHAAIRKWRIEP